MKYRPVLIGTMSVLAALAAGCAKNPVSYSRDVHPILQNRCLPCHGPGGEGHAASGFSVQS